jgi:hypothetical protein
MSQKVEAQVATIASMSATTKASKEELQELQSNLKADQSLLIQWAEEKVQLAVQGHELLESYATTLDGDIASLTQFLTDTGQLVDEYMPDDYGVTHEAHMYDSSDQQPTNRVRRSTSSRLAGGYTTSMDGYEDEQPAPAQSKPAQQKLRTNIPLTINRQQANSVYADGNPSSAHPSDSFANGDGNTSKRRRGNDTRRRSASAAVHATTAVVAALYDDEEYVEPKVDPNQALAVDPANAQVQLAPIPLEPFIPGLKECAKKPQAARRRLTENDISMALVGKIAEVFWVAENPEETMWYLVKVESVDLAAKTACVRYQNGEVEPDLNLAEVAQEGHMLLV